MVELLAILSALGGTIAGGTATVFGGAAVAAVNELYAGILGLLKIISGGVDGLAAVIESETLDTFAQQIRDASDPSTVLASAILDPAKEKFRRLFRTYMERELTNSIGPILEEVSGQLSGSSSAQGNTSPEFDGMTDAAQTTANRAIDQIEELVANEVADFKATSWRLRYWMSRPDSPLSELSFSGLLASSLV